MKIRIGVMKNCRGSSKSKREKKTKFTPVFAFRLQKIMLVTITNDILLCENEICRANRPVDKFSQFLLN